MPARAKKSSAAKTAAAGEVAIEEGTRDENVEQRTRSGRVVRKRVQEEKMPMTKTQPQKKTAAKEAAKETKATNGSVKTAVVEEKEVEAKVPTTKKQPAKRQRGAPKRATESNTDNAEDKQNEMVIDSDTEKNIDDKNEQNNVDNSSNESTDDTKDSVTPSTIYEFTVKDAEDNDVSFVKYKGYPVLIVNVASRCGHTLKNYTQMKEILEKYHSQADIYEKISVNGAKAHPFYKFLKAQQGDNEPIKWNFAKFLVDKNGFVVKRYLPKTQPKDIVEDIEKVIAGGSV
ncbi:unnamed protein product [Anisakis simplex]|uniref:Glutathione peroxidase n=1 Tax=Anisakis simplex TaxID=6269 RepID=A0A0M3K3Y4_ANISI|nr:unnamed protein product [Anisakis simplex]